MKDLPERTEELDLVTHQRDAIRGEITRLRTENTRLRNSNQVDRDLLAELVEAFRRREARRDVQLATLRAGLREVESSGCHNYLHRPFSCFEFGRTLSLYTADRACDACIAHRALRESEATP